MELADQMEILQLMKGNGFNLAESDPDVLNFEKTKGEESIRVNILFDPLITETKYTNAGKPGNWTRKTFMVPDFDKLKEFAEKEVNMIVENLRAEFNEKSSQRE